MASRFVHLTDPKQVSRYLEADMLYYLLDGQIGKSCGGPAYGPYDKESLNAITENMRHCTYGILVEEDEDNG